MRVTVGGIVNEVRLSQPSNMKSGSSVMPSGSRTEDSFAQLVKVRGAMFSTELGKTTVRSAAKKFGVSKSTVHKDVSERLKYVNPQLYEQVKLVLEVNKAQRHIRGGMATRRKYKGSANTNIT